MRDWLTVPLSPTDLKSIDESISSNETINTQEKTNYSWLSIIKALSFSQKLKKKTKSSELNLKEQEESINEDLNSNLQRTLSYHSVSSIDTNHSTPCNSQIDGYSTKQKQHQNIVYKKVYWNHGGKHVQVTGEFDNWSASINMAQDTEDPNRYVIEIPIDSTKDIEYKFIVDGEWHYSLDLPYRPDRRGNVNNVFYKSN